MSLEDEAKLISAKTLNRCSEKIFKAGFMDGAADGQAVVYQTSFDMGYELGLSFGLDFGFICGKNCFQMTQSRTSEAENINCRVCINGTTPQQNVINLFNIQKESNESWIKLHKVP